MPGAAYGSSRSRPSSSIWMKPLVSNSSWRGSNGDGSAGVDRGELDDDALVALDQAVHDQLVGPGLELEVLERVDVQADRQGREVGRDVGLVHHDPLDPAGAVGNQLTTSQEAIRDRLLEERPEEVRGGRSGSRRCPG